MWKEPKFSATADDVQFAALLQEIGALVTSQIAKEKEMTSALQYALSQSEDRIGVEESMFGMSSASVAAIVFSEWKFSQDIVDYIGGSDHPETAPEYAVMGAKALKIAKVLASLGKPKKPNLSDEAVETARALVLEYGFSEAKFDEMVERVNKELDRNSDA